MHKHNNIPIGQSGMTGMGHIDDYAEKPRPSLFNVIKKLKEMTNSTFNRVCLILRVNEHDFRGDVEKEVTRWTNETVECLDPKEFNPKADEELEYGGYAICLGPWVVYMFEAEDPLMKWFLGRLNDTVNTKGSIY